MNIHPIFVHFPVALLTLYTLMEFVRFKALTRHPAWFYVKGFLLVAGAISALVARQTGELIEDLFRGSPQHDLLEMHALWANVTVVLFGSLAVLYVAAFIRRDLMQAPVIGRIASLSLMSSILSVLAYLFEFVTRGKLILFFALFGLIAITITGGLGGALVYGPDIDPVVSFIYDLFF